MGSEKPSPRPIRVLSDDLANQIAAGEVVERPASVVKELLENAIDAGARRIHITIETGGIALVKVTDDGTGMDPGDARLSLTRHATSKIRSLDELQNLGSFGFRGEALPSIGSVSRLTLRTRTHDADEGFELRLSGGGDPQESPCGVAVGTSVEVRDLFFNVPARRKFLRAVGTESAHVTEVVQAAALSQPTLTFLLERDGRLVREFLSAPNRQERVASVLNGEALAVCRGHRGPMQVEAFLSKPERARAGAGGLSLFVNGRPVRDRALARAVAHGYGSVLSAGRYPIGVVYIDVPPESVDVNVHPQKAEVRFSEGRAIADALYRIVSTEVGQAFGIAQLTTVPSAAEFAQSDKVRPVAEGGGWTWPSAAPQFSAASGQDAATSVPADSNAASGRSEPKESYGGLKFLAQVQNTFLICEGEDGLYVLDQHAAAERVTFDRLSKGFHAKSVATQKLLFPTLVEVSPAEVAIVEEAQAEIDAAGMELRVTGPTSIAVHAVPQLLGRMAPDRLVRDLLGELGRVGERAFSGAIDLALATMACHGSIRAGEAVSAEEATSLLQGLDAVDFAGHCPHGRPILMRISFGELLHRVGRR